MATAIQNIGLVIAPTIVGVIKDNTREVGHGYVYTMAFFILINVIGLILNLILYYLDVNYHNSVLDSVQGNEEKPSEPEI